MAKIDLDRLAKRHGIDKRAVNSINYSVLMRSILATNTQNITEAIAKLSDEHWNKSLGKIKTSERRFILPDVSEVLPKDQIYIKKAAEQGQLITNTLRDRLSQDLRDAMDEFRTKVTDEPAFLRRRGTAAGTINPKLVDLFQAKITDTFENYTKKDPRFGVPSNIKTIAVTEARSAINDIKRSYTEKLLADNPGIRMRKRWKQNKGLAKEPRKGHDVVNGQTIDYNEKFNVPLIDKKGRNLGSTLMDGPHDPSAPLEQIIGCNCDIEHFAEVAT